MFKTPCFQGFLRLANIARYAINKIQIPPSPPRESPENIAFSGLFSCSKTPATTILPQLDFTGLRCIFHVYGAVFRDSSDCVGIYVYWAGRRCMPEVYGQHFDVQVYLRSCGFGLPNSFLNLLLGFTCQVRFGWYFTTCIGTFRGFLFFPALAASAMQSATTV